MIKTSTLALFCATCFLFTFSHQSLRIVDHFTQRTNIERPHADVTINPVDESNLTAAIPPTVALSGAQNPGGAYQVCYAATVTQAASVSSTLGGAQGLQVLYTDADDGNAKISPSNFGQVDPFNNVNGSLTSTCVLIWTKAGTPIEYQMGYLSSGSTPMEYNLHVRFTAQP